MDAVRSKLDGMGIPVKYLEEPSDLVGMRATVALKRARRARPPDVKRRREATSSVWRRPRV
jgi:hypothetical protein